MKKNHSGECYLNFLHLPLIFLRVMKLSVLLTCILSVNVMASVYSQNARFDLDMKDQSVRDILKTIEKESEFRFFYNDEFTDLDRKLTFSVTDKSIEDLMSVVLDNTDVSYKMLDNNFIVITPKSLLQQHQITGTVTDEKGNTLPGVTVLVKGTTLGTLTDASGKYTINNAPQNATLVFSFIGMTTQEIPSDSRILIDVVLKVEAIGLEEVVVVGYGTQKKENLTGAVATVNSKALEARPVVNVAQALEGTVPGLNITQSGALAGSLENRPTLNIRGLATIGQGSTGAPLILIDGMEGDINALNPNDVESISVLKDAAASSIYGSRAPFGVILVTTKKGKSGKTQFSYSSNFRSNRPVLLPSMVDSYTFALVYNEGDLNDGQTGYFTPERIQRIKDFIDGKIPPTIYNGVAHPTTMIPDPNNPNYWAENYATANANTNWFHELYKSSAPSQEHAFSINGGNEKMTYYVSGNYLGQEGLIRFGGDNFNRYTLTAKINGKLNDWASISYTGRLTRENYSRPSYLENITNARVGTQGWPVLPVYDPNGYLFDPESPAMKLRDGGRYKNQNDWNYQQFNLTIEPIKGWRIIADLNYKINDNFLHTDYQITYNHDVAGNPYVKSSFSDVQEQAIRTNYFSPDIYTDYSKKIGDHNIKVIAGFQSELNRYRSLLSERQGMIVSSLPVLDITSGTDITGKTVPPGVGGNYYEWATAGYFGRINYDYKERYLLELNLRYDGTSRFRSENRWNYFPSASLGWNISREEFWKPLEKYISTLKFRASFGKLGNQNTSSWYPTYVTMPVGTANGDWLIGGARPNTASAPGLISSTLTWERVSNWNAGIDAGFLTNKLSANFDYFVRKTNDMVGPAPELPVTLGTSVPTTNNTDLQTYGFDLSVKWQDQFNNGFGYNISFVLSDSRTKILRYPNPTNSIGTYRAGEMYGEIWGFTTIGIAKTQEEMDAHLASLPNGGQNYFGSNWKAGDIMYKDINGDGKIDAGSRTIGDTGDLTIIGNEAPRYSFGLNLGADWKGFDLKVFLQGILKRDFFQNSFYFFGLGGGPWDSFVLKQHLDYFRDDPNNPLGLNLDSYYPRPYLSDGKNEWCQTRWLQNAAYIRIKNIQLGYTVPVHLSQKIGIDKLRFYVSGENLLTFTRLATMFDPETIDGGWGGGVYPLSKVYSAGLSVNF